MGRKDSLPDDAPAPRLCELVKWPHFQGYGFNLHSEKGKEGQFIGKVDPESPAEACGLQEGDQIIEVNGVNTSNENHKQVVERIKTHSDRASLLVVDAKAAEYYKKRNILVNGTMSNVKHMKSAPAEKTKEADASSKSESTAEDSTQAASQGDGGDEPPPPVPPKTELASEDNSSAASAADEPDSAKPASEPEEKPDEAKPAEDKAPDEPEKQEEKVEESKSEEATEKKTEEEKPAEEKSGDKSPAPSEGSQDRKSEKPAEKAAPKEANGTKDLSPTIDTSLQVESGSDRTQPSPAPSAGSTSTVESAKSAESGSTAAEGDKFGLKLNMTAAEMREYLKSKKRPDPRKDNLTFKQRHEIVQNM